MNRQELEAIYRSMLRIRRFDEGVMGLFKEGLVKGTAHSYVGQEAVAAGACAALTKEDFVVSHHREEDFKADGLRTYAKYRDLGIAEASRGLARAHVIRLVGPCNPAEVSKLHFHDVEFQMVYVLKGWIKTYMEGQGETLMKEGSAWTQPPRIKHLIMDYSDDVELLEVILPAEFKTVELSS